MKILVCKLFVMVLMLIVVSNFVVDVSAFSKVKRKYPRQDKVLLDENEVSADTDDAVAATKKKATRQKYGASQKKGMVRTRTVRTVPKKSICTTTECVRRRNEAEKRKQRQQVIKDQRGQGGVADGDIADAEVKDKKPAAKKFTGTRTTGLNLGATHAAAMNKNKAVKNKPVVESEEDDE